MIYVIIIVSLISISLIIKYFKVLERFENIPLFVISLKRAQDRRQNIIKKMKDINQSCIIFDAVDGKNMNNYQKSLCNKFDNLSDGEKGCFLSHYLLWKKILESGYDEVIIFEDDGVILDNINFKNIQQFLVPEYDAIYLGFCYEKYGNKDKVKQLKDYSVYKTNYVLCTHAYILSKSGINKLLKYLEEQDKWNFPVDHVMNKIDNFNKYLLSPQLVKQSGEKSFIRTKNFLFFDKLL